MQGPVHNGFVNVYVPIPDFQIETAVRVSADPRLVLDGGSLAAKIG